MKLIIAGCRSFNDMKIAVPAYIAYTDSFGTPDQILSGMARGADTLGVTIARMYQIELIEYKPDWSVGRHAGLIRNRQMAMNATNALIFWDESSRGTANMLGMAYHYNVKTVVIKVRDTATRRQTTLF